jgi:hypothetical protein
MNGYTTELIWGCPADFVDVSHLWPLSIMAAVPTDAVAPDPEDLRDDLEYDIIASRQELKARGYDLADYPDVIKETRALHLPLDAQIQKLQKCAKRIRILLMRPAPSSTTPSALSSASAPPLIGPAPSSNSPSTLLSASAPSANALITCGKQVNKRRREGNARRSVPGRRVSYVDPTRAPGVPQHGVSSSQSRQTAAGWAEIGGRKGARAQGRKAVARILRS